MKWVGFFLLFGLLAGEAQARCDRGERVIRLGMSEQSDAPARQRAVANLRSAINLEMQGRACLQVVADDSLYSSSLSVTALQAGTIQLAVPSFTELGDFAPDFKVFDLPFAFRDLRAAQRFSILVGTRLNDQLQKFDVMPLAVWHGYFDQMSAKQPVHLPSDLAGLKVAAGSHPNAAFMVTSLDAVAQTVDAKQIAAAVKDGRVDAQFANWRSLRETKSAEIHDGVTETNHAYRGFQLLVSKSWWDGLQLRIKGPLRQIFPRITKQANFDIEQRQTNAKRALINAGAPVRGLTRRQRQAWLDRLKPAWDQIENRELVEILQRADRAL
jgi:C4-dicarboxylate-binding protein DctP